MLDARPPLRGYAIAIAAEIGTEDPAVLALAEALMRDEHRTLDALDGPRFRQSALDAVAVARAMRASGILDLYCQGMLLAVPASLPGDVTGGVVTVAGA